jgi:hypothetical protein
MPAAKFMDNISRQQDAYRSQAENITLLSPSILIRRPARYSYVLKYSSIVPKRASKDWAFSNCFATSIMNELQVYCILLLFIGVINYIVRVNCVVSAYCVVCVKSFATLIKYRAVLQPFIREYALTQSHI